MASYSFMAIELAKYYYAIICIQDKSHQLHEVERAVATKQRTFLHLAKERETVANDQLAELLQANADTITQLVHAKACVDHLSKLECITKAALSDTVAHLERTRAQLGWWRSVTWIRAIVILLILNLQCIPSGGDNNNAVVRWSDGFDGKDIREDHARSRVWLVEISTAAIRAMRQIYWM